MLLIYVLYSGKRWWGLIGDFAEKHQIQNPPMLPRTLSLYAEGLVITKINAR